MGSSYSAQGSEQPLGGEEALLPMTTRLDSSGSMTWESLRIYYGTAVLDAGEAQPLTWLKDEADYIAECTGCHSAEAVAFLLSDWLPDTPWVNPDFEATIPTVVLRIAISRVTPKEVSEAYEMIAEKVFGQDAHKRRSPLGRVHQLLRFVGERFPNGRVEGWASLHAEFDAVHPGAYKNAQSMQATFYKHKALLKYIVADIASERLRQHARVRGTRHRGTSDGRVERGSRKITS